MSKRANNSKVEKDESSLYYADGIISLHDYEKIEILLLETSKHFDSIHGSKSSFDHHKGLFGSLSLLKAIADTYFFGTMETFSKVNFFCPCSRYERISSFNLYQSL